MPSNDVFSRIDCGLTHIKDDEIKAILKERVPAKNGEIDELKFGEITE